MLMFSGFTCAGNTSSCMTVLLLPVLLHVNFIAAFSAEPQIKSQQLRDIICLADTVVVFTILCFHTV
jgi:hypothetical protein